MKRISSILLIAALLAGFATVSQARDDDRSHILKIYNWADYIDEDLLDEFQVWYREQTGEEIEI